MRQTHRPPGDRCRQPGCFPEPHNAARTPFGAPTRNRWAIVALALVAAPAFGDDATTRPRELRTWRPIALVGLQPADGLDARDRWMPTAVEEVLTRRLRRVPGLAVVSTMRAYQARREMRDGDQPPPWPRVLAALGVKTRIGGTVAGPPHQCRIRLELVGDRGEPVTGEFGPARMFDALDQATEWLLGRLVSSRVDDKLRRLLLTPPARSPSALEYYARAVIAARKDNMRDVVYYLEKAADYDPGQPQVQIMLAQVEARTSPEARATAAARLRHIQRQAQQVGDVGLDLDVELTHGAMLVAERSFESAAMRFARCREIATERGDVYRRIAAINALADTYLSQEAELARQEDAESKREERNAKLAAASALLDEALDLLARLGDRVAEGPIANKHALLLERLGLNDRALEMHQRSLAAAEAIGSRANQATAWMFLGQWYRRAQRYDEALDATRKCLELASRDAHPRVRIALADIYAARGDTEEALREFQQAYDELIDTDDLQNQLLCLERIAELQAQRGRNDAAVDALTDALDIAEVLEWKDRAAKIRARRDQLKRGAP
ncbi:MAG: tetratricopeptide repeat protein [Planctomycetota bacterium]|nr:MAG: tetratricopeptide repeat protein [Planctomycetota bacterium]